MGTIRIERDQGKSLFSGIPCYRKRRPTNSGLPSGTINGQRRMGVKVTQKRKKTTGKRHQGAIVRQEEGATTVGALSTGKKEEIIACAPTKAWEEGTSQKVEALSVVFSRIRWRGEWE